jgi:O-antigen ligase
MEHGCASAKLTHPATASRVQLYALCEELTGLGIASLLVFGPWAFGSTQHWSIWTLNFGSYLLGILFATKLMLRMPGIAIRSSASCLPDFADIEFVPKSRCGNQRFVYALAGLQAAILLYCLTSAINARATSGPIAGTLNYHECVSWLPHSLDSRETWEMFWRLLAVICFFWSVCDWLRATPFFSPSNNPRQHCGAGPALSNVPPRLECLLAVLTLSGGLLAFEGIVQRTAHSPKLLFVLQPQFQNDPFTQFASFAYRGNAAQYFNLLWPVCFVFTALSASGLQWRRGRNLTLVLCVGAMSAASIISGSRAPALASLALLICLVPMLFNAARPRHGRTMRSGWVLLAVVVAFFASASALGWKQMRPRMDDWRNDLNAREQLFERARLISRDYPVFGTGPGTFERVYGFYRCGPSDEWPAQLHNDWLEARVTFGLLGSALLALSFGVVLLPGFKPASLRIDSRLVFSIWLVLAGCLAQARWDFPLQISSIQFLFTFWCAAMFSLPQESQSARR